MNLRAMDRPATVTRPRTRASAVQSWLRGAALFALAVGTHVLEAADDNKIIFPSGNTTTAAPAATGGGAASTLTLILAVILAAVGAWMIWRNRRGPGAAGGMRNLAVEETRSLGNRQYLVVASYEGKKFLLGVCPGRIDMLAPLNERRAGGEVE